MSYLNFMVNFNINAVKLFCYLIPLMQINLNNNPSTSLTNNGKKSINEYAFTKSFCSSGTHIYSSVDLAL
jgi:hypothetical protein